jgi:hypothetical protein
MPILKAQFREPLGIEGLLPVFGLRRLSGTAPWIEPSASKASKTKRANRNEL